MMEDTGNSLMPTVSSLATNLRRQIRKANRLLVIGDERDSQLIDILANADDHAHRIQIECLRDD